jgi:hypothetical protein
MALYATKADVQASIQNTTITATTKPSLSDVDGFIKQISGDMEMSMRICGINLPVVGGLDFLKRVCIFGVVAHVYRSVDESETRWKEFERLYDHGKAEICKAGNAIFANSSLDTPKNPPTYTWEDREGDDIPFQRNKAQW